MTEMSFNAEAIRQYCILKLKNTIYIYNNL